MHGATIKISLQKFSCVHRLIILIHDIVAGSINSTDISLHTRVSNTVYYPEHPFDDTKNRKCR